jgi:TetR/AcrR family transcriptional regulator, transcriptional repressor for nem operon
MTDSKRTRSGPGDKRHRLTVSARELLHRQGAAATTLAQVAEAAQVPPGNVYYYFKTKDDLVRAAIESWAGELRTGIESCAAQPDPPARLKALMGLWVDQRDLVARFGCPVGSLCSELDKRDDALVDDAGRLLRVVMDWAEEQFRELGRPDARECASILFGGVQGAALIANTLRDPEVMTAHVRHLEAWIDSMAQPSREGSAVR